MPTGTTGAPGWRTVPLRAMSRRRPLPFPLALGLVVAGLLAACGGGAPSFDPTGVCVVDGAAPGAYPDLEARIPTTFEEKDPETLDSGRNCTATNLGSLGEAGHDEVRFAGGTWDFGGNRAAALVVFSAPDLTADQVATFYAESAAAANRTEITGESTATMAGETVHRLDSTTGNRLQTVVVWPAAEPGIVNIVITNDLPDPKIEAAVAAFGGS